MMKPTSIKIDGSTKDKINSLVKKGYFDSLGAFMREAAKNLLLEYNEMFE